MVLYIDRNTGQCADTYTDRDPRGDKGWDRDEQWLGEPRGFPPRREHTEGMVHEEEAEAKPLMGEEDEGCRGCSELRCEPGASLKVRL